ncbi:MAG: DoxX family protein [Longimonas sp.]|uniref:DoxX family protein n=1 Tax=Longimonas sp. TaxID=2039626 RepID=UPI003974AB70
MTARDYAYWISTGLLSLMMAGSAYMYFTSPDIAASFENLGFPAYFRIELGIAKLLGVVALLAPVPHFLKEWAYFGFIVSFVSAFIAHTAVGDPVMARMMPLVALTILAVSYMTYRNRRSAEAPVS